MPQIVAVGLGTLYTVSGAKQSTSSNKGPMQTLVWLAKNNRPVDKRKTGPVSHPWHPSGAARTLTTPEEAYLYAAEIFTHPKLLPYSLNALGVAGWPIALVPIPASSTTRGSGEGERWPALAFARELERHGVGRVRRCVVNKAATNEQTASGARTPAHEIAANLELLDYPKEGEAVVFVDDVITWGKRMAAVNHVLGWSGPTAAVCIAFTSDGDVVDCLDPKKRVIAYDATPTPWVVTISKAQQTPT